MTMLGIAFALVTVAGAVAGFASGLLYRSRRQARRLIQREVQYELERRRYGEQIKALIQQRERLQRSLDTAMNAAQSGRAERVVRARGARDSAVRVSAIADHQMAPPPPTLPRLEIVPGSQVPLHRDPYGRQTVLIEAGDVLEEELSRSEFQTIQMERAPAPPPRPLEAAVAEVAQSEGHRATVVSDELGFSVVGVGADQDRLAALCGILVDVRQQALKILEVGPIRRMTFEHANGLNVSVCTDDTVAPKLALATVTSGAPVEDTSKLLQALAGVGAALQPPKNAAGGHS